MAIPKEVTDFLIDSYHKGTKIFACSSDMRKDLQMLGRENGTIYKFEIVPFYSVLEINAHTSIFNFVIESLKNTRMHSDKPSQIEFTYFLAPQRIAFSYFDGGSYFSNEEVKRTWEGRTNQDKHLLNVSGYGASTGRRFLFDHADLIHVDTNTATLYTGLKTTNEIFFENK